MKHDELNYKYTIEELFGIMSLIREINFDKMQKKYDRGDGKFAYMLIKLRESDFIKFNNNGDEEDMPMFFGNPYLTFKGNEYLKIWNTSWINHEIKNTYGYRISDLSMYTYFELANRLFLNRNVNQNN